MSALRLSRSLDLALAAETYHRCGRVRVTGLLRPADALRLHAFLDAHDAWWQLINMPDGLLEIDRKTRAKMGAKRRAALDRTVCAGARTGFQYRYESLRVPDDPHQRDADDPLSEFARLMASPAMLAALQQITGHAKIAFADGHATAYGPGDFLTGHDDNVAGKQRLAAYVFGLTRVWRPEWGGILLFHEPEGALVSGHVPCFNTLDLFAVPQRHSVSMVTESAAVRRFAVTGWLNGASEMIA